LKIQACALTVGLLLLAFGVVKSEQVSSRDSHAARLFARATPDDFLGDEACSSCHSNKTDVFGASPHAAFVAHADLPLEKRGCEGCHGPGAIHLDEDNPDIIAFRKMTPDESSKACLRCHGDTLKEAHWKQTEHSNAGLSCVSCHQIHPDSDPDLPSVALRKGRAQDPRKPVFVARVEDKAMLRADEATLCGQCHAPEVAEFRLHSHHPVPEGRMLCSDCHTPHPTKNAKVRKDPLKDDCVTCHAEVAGPFVFEHDPVAGHTGLGCKECHRPHGSNNPKMLNSMSRGLCGQCHTDKLFQHYPGRSCWASGCHVAPHGSNTDPRFLRR
jgi:predicted CXXCH cytochrome family protein